MDSVKGLEFVKYSPEMRREWDEFVKRSRNGTFLFERGYMDYHSDRFADCSWLAFKNGKLRAMLPANLTPDGVLHSHQGLTYGGWILPMEHVDGAELLEIFRLGTLLWNDEGIVELDYKPVPHIYAHKGAEEDIYALYRLGAIMSGCCLSVAVNLREGYRLSEMQRRHLKKTVGLNWHISEEEHGQDFMEMLQDCLSDRHSAAPVHTLSELELLRERFPGNIRIFTLRLDGDMLPDAGVCVYDTGRVAHMQYIATTRRGRELNLLTPLFVRLMDDIFAGREWFDFGTSNEEGGRILNPGLLRQKFSYGGGGVIYPRYSLRLSNADNLSHE